MSVAGQNLPASLLCSHAECLVRVRWNVNNGGFVKCTDLRVGRIGPLSVAGHNLRASFLCSHAECPVRVRCTQMEKHCTASPSFPSCKKWKETWCGAEGLCDVYRFESGANWPAALSAITRNLSYPYNNSNVNININMYNISDYMFILITSYKYHYYYNNFNISIILQQSCCSAHVFLFL